MTKALTSSMLALALVACGPPSSMLRLEHATESYAVRFSADEDTLAIRITQPGGVNLVFFDPVVEDGRVVVAAGLVSSGGPGESTQCREVRGAPLDWRAHVVWREPGGALTPIVLEPADDETLAACTR